MSERKTMKTFFAAMNEQVGMGGYGSKIKTTPMGAFKWNDLLQLWENVNNGMQLNNIAFQDMFMMDYETNSGDSGTSVDYTPILTPSDWGNLQTMDIAETDYWASSTGPQLLLASGTAVTFTGISSPISVTLTISTGFGSAQPSARIYSLNGGARQLYSTALTINNNDTLKVGVATPGGSGTGEGNLVITNATTSTVLDNIPYAINIEL